MAELLEPGSRLAGKYVIDAEIGGGAMGVVFSAMHEELRQRVAIKVLRHAGAVAAERMMREARATVVLHSEHIVRVMDVGHHGEHVFLVMEQLEGEDLATTLRNRGPLPREEAVDYVLQACAGVAEAHARGVIHRDLKPSNLFLTRRSDGSPLVKVLDFGISKVTSGPDAEASLTGPAEVIGSPMYMAPEQIRATKDVDHRTDIWALGVILFRLLTGKAPFAGGGTIASTMAAVLEDDPTTLRGIVPDVPRALEAVTDRCLAKDPEDRFASVADLAAALAPFGSDDGRAAVVRLVRDRVPEAPTRERRLKHPVGTGLAVFAAVVLLAAAFAARTGSSRVEAPSSSAPPPSPSVAAVADSPPAPAVSAAPAGSSTTSAASGVPASRPAEPPRAPFGGATGPPAHRPLRSHPPGSSSVVRSPATDDRY